jgi:D-lactate dehydrogenase
MKVLVYSARPYDQKALHEYAQTNHELIFTDKKLGMDAAALAAGFDAIALFTSDDASEQVLQKLSELGVRFITLRSAGYDHVNLKAAAQLGIQVANVPAYSPYSVAEHAVAMLMASNRKMVKAQKLIEAQDFRLDELTGFDVHGKTVGVIGTGNIGLAFAKIMIGFGARVIAVDPVESREAIDAGVTYVSFDELLTTSDIISIHCPLNASTRYMFSAPQFLKMKPTVTLINTSRGALINTHDLIAALTERRLGAVCLDVYEKEKGLFFNDWRNETIIDSDFKKLRSFPNVLITGHQGFLTHEALQGIAKTTFENLDHWRQQRRSPNQLTQLELVTH